MCTCPVKRQDADLGVFLVYKEPVRGYVAFTVTLIVSMQAMVTIAFRERFIISQQFDNIKEVLKLKTAFLSSFQVLFELTRYGNLIFSHRLKCFGPTFEFIERAREFDTLAILSIFNDFHGFLI